MNEEESAYFISIPPDVYEPVLEFFKGDHDKTHLWFTTENPLLGGIKPTFMIAVGRKIKLRAFIKSQLEGNMP